MNTSNNKKKQKVLNILSNPQFILGSIINPIIPFNNTFGRKIEDNIGYSDNDELNRKNKEEKTIDVFFGSITEKPPSPVPNTDNIDNEDNTDNTEEISLKTDIIKNHKQLKQIYPVINKNNNKSIFTNLEIKEKIDKLSENEMCEIFKIIKNNSEKYSTNKNGIFINISTLKKITINEICDFISFCDNNNKIFNQEEQTRDIYRDILLEL